MNVHLRPTKHYGKWKLCFYLTSEIKILCRFHHKKLFLPHGICQTENGFEKRKTDFGKFQHSFRMI